MESQKYYNKLFKEDRDQSWNDAPGKKVILSAFIDLIKNQDNKIIDIGGGNGYFVSEIKKHNQIKKYRQEYYAIDVSLEAIKKAIGKYKGINFMQMDTMKLIFEDNFFDIVISYGVFEHTKNPQNAIDEICRVLKNEGLFLLMIPSLDYYRIDRTDEGWYEDLDSNKQWQWNYLRKTWEEMFRKTSLKLFDIKISKNYGALKPGVFFFGKKDNEDKIH